MFGGLRWQGWLNQQGWVLLLDLQARRVRPLGPVRHAILPHKDLLERFSRRLCLSDGVRVIDKLLVLARDGGRLEVQREVRRGRQSGRWVMVLEGEVLAVRQVRWCWTLLRYGLLRLECRHRQLLVAGRAWLGVGHDGPSSREMLASLLHACGWLAGCVVRVCVCCCSGISSPRLTALAEDADGSHLSRGKSLADGRTDKAGDPLSTCCTDRGVQVEPHFRTTTA